ncbi:MAG: dihydrolipoyl dehydrogenase family protein [Burkholderiales bacterium]
MFDLLVIGSGPGGYRAAVLAAQRGLSVAIAEKYEWGGACLNRGCVPKKAWYSTARLAAAAPGFAERGLRGTLEPDLGAAWRYQRKVVETVRTSYVDYLARLKITCLHGAAQFVDREHVTIGAATIAAGRFIVATGSRPVLPQIMRGIPRVLTTDELFERKLPSGGRVALLGSGAVGAEMAFILPRLGLEVVWLTGSEMLARSRFSSSARKRLHGALSAQGVTPRSGNRPLRAAPEGERVLLELPGGAQERVDWVLAGTGRRPNTDALGLRAAGVRTDARGFITVDPAQRTSAQWIFALGDCANPAMTANHALAEATVAVANIVAPGSATTRGDWVPEVLYSALELARAGATEDELEDADTEYAVGFSAFGANPAALAESSADGYVRLLVEREQGTLLGCEFAGAEASELIHLAEPGAAGAPLLARLAQTRFAHPSRSEEFLNAAEALVAGWGVVPPR